MSLRDAEIVFARRFLAGPTQDATTSDLAHEPAAAVQVFGGAWAAHLAQGLLTPPPELQERGSRVCVSVRFFGRRQDTAFCSRTKTTKTPRHELSKGR